jgi:aminopeptidase N
MLEAMIRGLPAESDDQNVERLLAYLVRAFWRHVGPEERAAVAPAIERTLRRGIADARSPGAKAAWFAAYRDVASSEDAVRWIERLWRRQDVVEQLTFSEIDEIAMALELSVRVAVRAREILDVQFGRIMNPDRRAQFAFLMPALSPDPAGREEAFARLMHRDHRRREPWALQSLFYLNHPVREPEAIQFIRPSLEQLEEIQRTGDIFFPTRWVEAALNGHRSPAAAAIVREFLAETTCPQRLRWIVLTAADELFRAADAQSPVRRTSVPQ